MIRARIEVIVGALLLPLLASGCADQASAPKTHVRASVAYPFDSVPGLGRSDNATTRDEIISYYEAWHRDSLVSECMDKAGFDWLPEALYPEEEIVRVGQALGIQAREPSDVDWANEANLSLERALTRHEQNLYFQALYSESAEDINYWMLNEGKIPLGRDASDFATDGCSSVGWTALPSIWDLKSRLSDEFDQLRLDAQLTPEFASYAADYSSCLASHDFTSIDSPGELERQVLDASEAMRETLIARQATAQVNCDYLWTAANDAGISALEAEFVKRHAEEFQQQEPRYVGALDRISRDENFVRFVAANVWRVEAGS